MQLAGQEGAAGTDARLECMHLALMGPGEWRVYWMREVPFTDGSRAVHERFTSGSRIFHRCFTDV